LDAFFGRDVDCEPGLAFVATLVVEACMPFVESEEDYLREIERRVVLRDRLLFTVVEWIIADNGLDVGIFALS
jgi:hypothetical protein